MMAPNHLENLWRLRLIVHEHGPQSSLPEEVDSSLKWAASEYFPAFFPLQSAATPLTRRQKLTITGLLLLALVAGIAFPIIFLAGLYAVSTAYYTALLLLRLVLFRLSLAGQTVEAPITKKAVPERDLPVITILLPLYREADGVSALNECLNKFEYPRNKLDIKLLLEEDDPETIAAAAAHCSAPEYHHIIIPASTPRTKPKACNYGLWLAKGDYVVIYDAEDRPETDQLQKAVNSFQALPDEVACLQARLNYYNRDQNILTRLFALEYALLFDVFLPALCRLNAPFPLGGTSNFFRTNALLEVGGWDAYNVTEDADLGVRLAEAGYRSRVLDSTTWEEATADLDSWMKQRTRWIKGYLQTWLVHMRLPARPSFLNGFWRRQLVLHLIIAAVIISALINPIFWGLFLLWLAGFPLPLSHILPVPLAAMATSGFLISNLALLYLHIAAPLRRRWFAYSSYALLLPGYWILQSIAGYRALWQFIRDPFYWEKTTHHPEREVMFPPSRS